jgi:hypothetical protein
LTRQNPVRNSRQFFVSLNGSASCRSNGGTNFCSAKAEEIGAHDARHREHLMAPARQLTSSASLKGKEVVGKPTSKVRRLDAQTISGCGCRSVDSKTVADARFCLDQNGSSWIGLDLLAKMRDVNAKILSMLFGFRAPDFAQDLPVR